MTTPRTQRRWYLRLPALLLLLAIGVGQMLLALVFLRHAQATPETSPPAAEHAPAAAAAPAKAEHAPATHGEHDTQAEVDLGSFAMTVPSAKDHPTLLVSFHLYGTIAESHSPEFHERYESFQHRLRQEVLLAVRHASLADLTDPALTAFKGQLLARINRVLSPVQLDDLVFSDVAILEP